MGQPTDPGYLGNRKPTEVVLSADNRYVAGSWVATWRPQAMPPEAYDIYHIALRGPRGGFLVYIDDAFYSTASRSDINEYDPKQVMHVRPGQTITFHFRSAGAPAPDVWLYLKRPGMLL